MKKVQDGMQKMNIGLGFPGSAYGFRGVPRVGVSVLGKVEK
jgi:hypothetical protein